MKIEWIVSPFIFWILLQVIREKRAEFEASEDKELRKGAKVAFLDLLLRVKTADGQSLSGKYEYNGRNKSAFMQKKNGAFSPQMP